MARAQFFLDKFSPDGEFVVLRASLSLPGGVILKRGETVPKEKFTTRRLRLLYEARQIGRPANFVFVKPQRPQYDYDAALARGFENAARRDADEGRPSSLQLRAMGDAVDLRPRQPAVLSEINVDKLPPAAIDVEPQAVTIKPVEAQPAPTPSYGPEDMGLVEPAPKPKKKVKAKAKRAK